MFLFMLHDAELFQKRLCPAIAASARRKSFAPLRDLAADLAAGVEKFVAEHYLTTDERPLLEQLGAILFERRLWRFLAGEILLYAAAESPEIKIEPDVLAQWVGSDLSHRVFRGSREVVFEGFPYRPGLAYLHNPADLALLCAELDAIHPATWPAAAAADLDDIDREDELEWARDEFSRLRSMLQRARDAKQIVVCEEI